MANGVVSKEDFKKLTDTNIKLNILFETILSVKVNMEGHCKRLKNLEKKKFKDTGYAVGGGFLGGFAAMISKWLSGG